MQRKISIILFFFIVVSTNILKAQEKPVFVNEFLGMVSFVEGRVYQLADEVPADKFAWEPAEGIRSFAKTYMHLAGGNFICLQYTGTEVPKDVNFTMDFQKWDNSASSKEDVGKIVKRSFEELKKAVGGLTQAQLDEEVDFFNMKMSRRAVLVNMLNHLHEHQGQLIAYSRMNGITPPWSKKEADKN